MKSVSVNRQSGAVSLFVVIFSMLIITVITVSFIRLMIADQQQATNNDLSQSAYDSAQAGVEDAKRALLQYQQVCTTNPGGCSAEAGKFVSASGTVECNAALLNTGVISSSDESGAIGSHAGEIFVQQSQTGNDKELNQAYTCVKVYLDTNDYIGTLAAGESQLVPIVGEKDFDTVTVRWFSREDVSTTDGSVVLPGVSASHLLPTQANWNANTPSLMRAQLLQIGDTFTMSDFDSVSGSGGNTQSDANTVFLYPTSGVGATSAAFTSLDTRASSPTGDPTPASATTTAHPVQCAATTGSGGYACSMSLTLPTPVGGGSSRRAFLRLTPFYTATHFQVVLSNGLPTTTNSIIKFSAVQPMVDSTGRANDILRRVQSRVNLYNTDFPYPDATIDVNGNFCKTFGVSDVPSTYTATNTCTP